MVNTWVLIITIALLSSSSVKVILSKGSKNPGNRTKEADDELT